MSVTEDFIEYLTEGAVAIEVYGHRQADSGRNPALWDLSIIQAKTRTLRDRYDSAKSRRNRNITNVILMNTIYTWYADGVK